MTQNELPVGWIRCTLEDFCHINLGQSPDSSTYNDNATGLPFFQGKADFGKLYPTVTHWCSKPKKIAEKGDVLLSVRAPVGSVNISTEQCCIGRGLAALRGYFDITPLFIFYLIQFSENELHKRETGTTFKAITGDRLKSLPINLPPLAEQKRIVGKIEELFAEVDKGIDLLKQKQAELKKYRQSVLSAAFSGKLYKTTDWPKTTLQLVCHKITDGTHFTPNYVPTGIPFISVKDIYAKELHFDECKYISEEEHNSLITRCYPEYGDVLITKSGTIGRTCIVDTRKQFSLFVSVALLKPRHDKVTSSYLLYALDNYIAHIDVKQDVKGGVIKNLHLEDIKKIQIDLPPLLEQEQIVSEIEQRFEKADILEKSIEDALENAEKLKQSILKKAFEGKLVPQDPNDEPASVLLDRIKSEQTPKKGKKKCSKQ